MSSSDSGDLFFYGTKKKSGVCVLRDALCAMSTLTHPTTPV